MFIVVRLGTETTKYTAVGTCPMAPLPTHQTESRMLNKHILARLLLWGTVRA
jgi:hypothetical protein